MVYCSVQVHQEIDGNRMAAFGVGNRAVSADCIGEIDLISSIRLHSWFRSWICLVSLAKRSAVVIGLWLWSVGLVGSALPGIFASWRRPAV